jgi:hypothetical protein
MISLEKAFDPSYEAGDGNFVNPVDDIVRNQIGIKLGKTLGTVYFLPASAEEALEFETKNPQEYATTLDRALDYCGMNFSDYVAYGAELAAETIEFSDSENRLKVLIGEQRSVVQAADNQPTAIAA